MRDSSDRTKFFQNVSQSTVENLYRVYYNDFLFFAFSPESVEQFHAVAKGPPPAQSQRESAKEKLQGFSDTLKAENRLEEYKMCVANQTWKNDRDALYHTLMYDQCVSDCTDCNCDLIKPHFRS